MLAISQPILEKKPDRAMKAEFFGRVTCHVVWCVQLMYMEEDDEFEP
ncbi:hypothetical protein CRE_14720 [Caenorhabditis remanei]|uniref:Uncharacterized protein n=1 Tax=Caenorhabditis remanei TaxID=31234 RepID=E3M9R1_CAERE|nr:hypothetical protein CRE_14720 [Caenorhabditis remanei]